MTHEQRHTEARAEVLHLLARQMERLNRRRFDYRTARKLAGQFLKEHPDHGGHIRYVTADVLLMRRGKLSGVSHRVGVEIDPAWHI